MYKLYGALGSPYSIKMRAVLRYRRIPFVWVQGVQAQIVARERVRAPVIPVLEYPDGTFANDSTPLIFDLERRIDNGRSIVPSDSADAFLAYLIEDFADEWMTKAMFAYRWLRPRDQERMSTWLAFDTMAGGGRERFESAAAMFRARQVGRMAMVGCTEENAPLIEESTARLLAALEAHVVDRHFIFGARPSMAEFGLYGQLSQLGVDPTASKMFRAEFPYAFRWLAHMDDLSGIEGAWRAPNDERAPVISTLLDLIGDVYFPFLLANEAALVAGEPQMRFCAGGHAYVQAPFKYQSKCLAELRRAYAALSEDAKATLAPLLSQSNCLNALTAGEAR